MAGWVVTAVVISRARSSVSIALSTVSKAAVKREQSKSGPRPCSGIGQAKRVSLDPR